MVMQNILKMSKKYYPLIAALGALVLIGGGSYYLMVYRPGEDITTPEKAISVIASKLKLSNPAALTSASAEYLIAWAKGLRAGRDKFIVSGKSFNSLTGTAL